MCDGDFGIGFFFGLIAMFISFGIFVILITTPSAMEEQAEFICETHGKSLVHYEIESTFVFEEVICGPPKKTSDEFEYFYPSD